MTKTYPDLPEWTFEADEVSAGVYEVVGRDRHGNVVSSKGTNLDDLYRDCREKAQKLDR
jgi:hypothetical protein